MDRILPAAIVLSFVSISASKFETKKKNRPRAISARAVDLSLFLSWHRR
jgi:hypothetical protein